MTSATEAMQTKAPKTYTLPFIWAWGAPVFNATAAALISIQASTGIPWMSFIILCGAGCRLMLAPLMIRQMILINKMAYASPSFRLVAKLVKHSELPFYKRYWNGFKAALDYSRQTKTNLVSFYFYNMV
jgi:membrane protein insertase Oxa1/YidC/SpoIIIJ